MSELTGLKKILIDYSKLVTIKLKKEIVSAPHYITGDLYRSIHTKIRIENNNPVIMIEANDYIEWLDGGLFLIDFMERAADDLIVYIEKNLEVDIIKDII